MPPVTPHENKVLRVLIVDDHIPMRQATSIFLRSKGCRVHEAAEGHEAVKLYHDALAERNPYDVVLLDLNMPEGDSGGRAMIELLALRPRPRVVVCSGDIDNRLMKDWRFYGFSGRLVKPFQFEELWAELERSMGAA